MPTPLISATTVSTAITALPLVMDMLSALAAKLKRRKDDQGAPNNKLPAKIDLKTRVAQLEEHCAETDQTLADQVELMQKMVAEIQTLAKSTKRQQTINLCLSLMAIALSLAALAQPIFA